MDALCLVRTHKLKLMEALVCDADLLLQHCHARGILNNNEYNDIRDTHTRSTQVRDVLDRVMLKDERLARRFVKMLRTRHVQESFPKLRFLRKLRSNTRSANTHTEPTAKQRRDSLENDDPPQQPNTLPSRALSERDLMRVAGCIGSGWKALGIVCLDMTTATLQQIEEDQRLHRERVFEMLRRWSLRQRHRATPARLHTLLTQEDTGLDPRALSFLLETH